MCSVRGCEFQAASSGINSPAVWDAKRGKALQKIEVSVEDFVRAVSQLMTAASELTNSVERDVHVYDTVPGSLAKDLVKPLGYKGVKEFLDVNVDHPF